MPFNVVYTDHGFENVDRERETIERVGGSLTVSQCGTEDEVITAARDADGVLVQWAPMPERVIRELRRCRVIVRVGIGVDNVDLDAAAARGITVCNVPDYCISEVADHTLALALALARDLPQVDKRVRSGTWKISPTGTVRAFSQMTFGTIGFGRIARAVHRRAEPFGFRRMAYDPFISGALMAEAGVDRAQLDDVLAESDILSLHAALGPENRHVISNDALGRMKSTALLINTSRGGLVDTVELATALEAGTIAGAALDVFETEPLPDDHPLRDAPNTILTSHVAWFSQESLPRLQQMAAEEVAGFLSGQPPRNPVNRPVAP